MIVSLAAVTLLRIPGLIIMSTIIPTCRGTSMTGGSSGGPWIANYGVNAVLSGVNYGNNANRNIILVRLRTGEGVMHTQWQGLP